ncbi:MAG: hypothetical protein IKQ35_00700 [Bacilli bacterium]|nr:hypothetical protein [Bacilli bacterium]
MDKMPKTIISGLPEVKTLSVNRSLSDKDGYREYIVNSSTSEQTVITTGLYNSYVGSDDDVIESEEEFTNGFKVVMLNSGQFGYVRESDNRLLPNRYDIALNFNEYGFAMVGRDGRVSWVNSELKYQSILSEEMIEDDPEDRFTGWEVIHSFSEGEEPLSLMSKTGRREYREEIGGYYDTSTCSYLTIDGSKKKFRKFDENGINREYYSTRFSYGEPFNNRGTSKVLLTMYGENKEYLILASGYYMNIETFVNLADVVTTPDTDSVSVVLKIKL